MWTTSEPGLDLGDGRRERSQVGADLAAREQTHRAIRRGVFVTLRDDRTGDLLRGHRELARVGLGQLAGKSSLEKLDEIAIAKLGMVGLRPEVADRFPSELSGGMIKRVALARALALDPELVFLDEPTSGLDPIGAAEFDALIRTLQRTLGLSVFMVTHDLDSLHTVCDRIAVLSEGRVIATGPIETMLASEHPWLKSYFRGKRGRLVHH